MTALPGFGLNRFDFSSPHAFAADVRRAETLGWDFAFIPSSPLRLRDPYVNLAFAAVETSRIGVGPLLETPMIRSPAVLASSIATVDELAPGRTLLALGAGDTAVRLMGQRPARVAELEATTSLVRGLLQGEKIDVGAARPAQLRHARPVPVWIAAGGPKTLHMAGRVADGVFIRVGRHPANIETAITAIHNGAAAVGRNPSNIKIGVILHTILSDDLERAACISRAMAAGYYEYTPALFDPPGFIWNGPDIHTLKKQVWPDFHHAADLVAAGRVVSFLSQETADAFSLYGTPQMIAEQLSDMLKNIGAVDMIIPHPVPTPHPSAHDFDFMTRFQTDVVPCLKALIPQQDPKADGTD